jgi:hypothetical protein
MTGVVHPREEIRRTIDEHRPPGHDMFSLVARSCVFMYLILSVAADRAGAQSALLASELNDDHVRRAIAAIVDELYARKHAERFWDPEKVPVGESTRQKGGYTALTVLAMLYAGQTYQDPRMRDAADFLADFTMEGTYAVSLRNSIWARLPARYGANLSRDTQWLLDGFSEKVGGWDYVQNARTGYRDNSIRQFGALALWESAKRGLKVDRRFWLRLEEAYLDMQLDDGGWNYRGDGPATGSMTAAGLATLFITQDFLHAAESVKLGSAKPARHEQAIERGLQWMGDHFSPSENPGKNTYFYYYLFGVERVGLASGYARFGGRDWYRLGAAELIRRLCKWDDAADTCTVHEKTAGDGRASTVKVDDLAFGLMFLSRGRVPVAINKLDVGGSGKSWNNRPRDVANLVRWISETAESDLNWQIVPMSDDPERWLDAPLLYIASNEPLPCMREAPPDVDAFVRAAKEFVRQRSSGELPMDAQPPARPAFPGSADLDKLKRYLDLGGMIFALNEGPSHNFADSVERAGQIMYPHYEWRMLPPDHWAYTVNLPVNARQPPLKGLSNGVRELMILSSGGDLPAIFQAAETRNAPVYQTAANIYFYSSEMNRPRPRLAQHVQPLADDAKPSGAATIVRAIHQGHWKPEPLALPMFADWVRANRGIDVRILDHPLSTVHALTPRPDVIVVSGVDAIDLTPAQNDALSAYIAASPRGVVFFETAGGRGDFARSAEEVVAARFDAQPQGLGSTALVTGEGLGGGAKLTRVNYRPFTMEALAMRENTPRLRGIIIDGQPRVLFSDEDISNALLDQPRWGVSGYSPASARDLLANILQQALTRPDVAAP